jgi:hypothetical protein
MNPCKLEYATVGAEKFAKGNKDFDSWSKEMIKEFGERIRPGLRETYDGARAIHLDAEKAFRSPEAAKLAAAKTRTANDIAGLRAKIERGDFTKEKKTATPPDRALYQMRQRLAAMKGEFDRYVQDIERKNATLGQKAVTHTAGGLRAGVLSSPAVIGKLGVAAVVKEGLAPVYGTTRWGFSQIPGLRKIADISGRNPSLEGVLTSEGKAKLAAITQGIKDSIATFKGGSELDKLSGKDQYTRYWYDKATGGVHAAIKAPVRRAEFVRSLSQRIETAMRNGEDVNHPAVVDRIRNEALIDADRQILQNSSAWSNWIGQLNRMGPAGKIIKALVAPVSRVPANLVVELWNHTLGVPHALLRTVTAHAQGLESLKPATADSIMRQFSQGTLGLALSVYAWRNHEEVSKLLKMLPTWFQHTSQAMVLQLFANLGEGDQKEINKMAQYDIPFMKTFTDASEPLQNASKPRWQQSKEPWAEYGRKQVASRLIPEAAHYVTTAQHTPGNLAQQMTLWNKPVYSREETQRHFHPKSISEAMKDRFPRLP